MSRFVVEGPSGWNWSKSPKGAETFHSLVVNGLVVACLTVLLTVSDAFETGHLGLAHQVALWVVVSVLLVAQLSCAKHILERILPANSLFSALAIALSLVMTILLMTIELSWMKYTPLLPKHPDPFFEFLLFLTPPMAAIASLVLLAQHLSQQNRKLQVFESRQATLEAAREKTTVVSDSVTDLAWLVQNYAVKHVQAEDHYLSVTCPDRKLFVRARMKDALNCLLPVDGIQVHRSHWVAREYIKHLYREGRDFKLVMQDDTVVPVARSRVKELRALL